MEGKDQLGVHFMDMNIIVGESRLPTWCSGRVPEVTRHQLLSPRGQMDNGINTDMNTCSTNVLVQYMLQYRGVAVRIIQITRMLRYSN